MTASSAAPSAAPPMLARPHAVRAATLLGVIWAAIVLFILGPAGGILDWDMFHEMALARELLATGQFPYRDSFAYTPTVYPVVHHEWGMGMLLLPLARGGIAGIYFAHLVLASAIVAAGVGLSRRLGANWPTLVPALMISAALGLLGYGIIRAQFLTLLFMTITLWMIESDRRGGRIWMAFWPLLFVAWLNIHGGFLVGLGILGLYWIEQAVRTRNMQLRLLLLVLASAALTGISPYGYGHLISVIRGVLLPRPLISEWFPIWTDPIRFPAFLASLAPVVYVLWRSGKKPPAGTLILAACAFMALRHLRHGGLYAVAWLVFVPAWIAATPVGRAFDAFWQRRAGILWKVLLFFVVANAVVLVVKDRFQLIMPTCPDPSHGIKIFYPIGAVDYLRSQQFRGNVMTPFEMGAYVSWKLSPAVKVSMDSRFEVAYPPEALDENDAFYKAKGDWRAVLAKYPTDLVLVRNNAKVAASLESESGWQPVYQDDVYLLYARPGLALPMEDRRGQPLLPEFP